MSAELETQQQAGTSGRSDAEAAATAAAGPSSETKMQVDGKGPIVRVLALYCLNSAEEDPGFDPPDSSNVTLLAARAHTEVSKLASTSRLNSSGALLTSCVNPAFCWHCRFKSCVGAR